MLFSDSLLSSTGSSLTQQLKRQLKVCYTCIIFEYYLYVQEAISHIYENVTFFEKSVLQLMFIIF